MGRIVSIDIETTGLDPTAHETWEITIVPLEGIEGHRPDARCYQLPVTLIGAESEALEIGRFGDRYTKPLPGVAVRRWPSGASTTEPLTGVLLWIHEQLRDATLLGCSVHFDASFIAELFRRQGFNPAPWHHRHLDLGSFTAGAWGAGNALSSLAMSDRIPNPDAHDALADALWNVHVYRSITAG
jgi:hypothetical protein